MQRWFRLILGMTYSQQVGEYQCVLRLWVHGHYKYTLVTRVKLNERKTAKFPM